jgi:quercetin dioxygenase-like cupin family protein
MRLRGDLTRWQRVPFERTAWTPSPTAGVERKMLERDGGEVARATSIVRYAKGSAFPAHAHARGEEFVVLAGTFADEHGSYPAHTYVRNPPGSRHRPYSTAGCTIFVKLRQFDPGDARRCAVSLDDPPGEGGVATSTLLHAFGTERVALVRLAAGATLELDGSDRGIELFVLRGEMDVGAARCRAWTWLRAPRAAGRLASPGGCVVWLKQGHLPPASTRG